MTTDTTVAVAVNTPWPVTRSWRALKYFNLYRMVIAGLFTALSVSGRLPPNFTKFDVGLFTIIACIYLALTIVAQYAIEWYRTPLPIHINALVLVDIVAITLFMHASGGVAGGFGILLVVALAGACLLVTQRASIFFAALATLFVLGETLYGTFNLDYASASYTQAGLLGAVCFGTAILATVLAERARHSEALAAQRAVDLKQLSLLNEHIVQRMRSGILVLDRGGRVVLANQAAEHMLQVGRMLNNQPLARLSATLHRAWNQWQRSRENRSDLLTITSQGPDVIASFTRLGPDDNQNTLVFLEDAAEMNQRAQQIKLASLGRLTASIAHEIRNPLGAISHAGQLLSESPELAAEDRRLTEIIAEHSARMNDIINNVLMIGRRETAYAESFALRPWLEDFVTELCERLELASQEVKMEWQADDISIRMDPSQLRQVLWNLSENGLRYSRKQPRLTFVAGLVRETGRPFVDVIDRGEGISDAAAEQIFEPFFTGEAGGTGLGLYIARELCEANQASLNLLEHGVDGCRFRVQFAHPERRQVQV